jgi:hypothetical protein
MIHLYCIQFVTIRCMKHIFVCDLLYELCVELFWCSNSKNLYVPMFLPMLYDVFHPFSSMLLILHVKKYL